MAANGYGGFLGGAEDVIKLDSGDDYTAFSIY